MTRNVRLLLAPLCLLLALAGCDPMGNDGMSEEAAKAALFKRAQAFWDAKARTDAEASYRYLEPEWKAKQDPTEWAGTFGLVKWTDPKVVDAKIDGGLAVIAVEFDWEVLDTWAEGSEGNVTFYEYWVNVGGVWYKEEPVKNRPASWDTFPERN